MQKQEIKGCIFDLDGVIVDTAVYHFSAWKRLANTLGIDFTEAENEKLKGVSRVDSLKLILDWGGVTKTESEQAILAQQKNAWYVEMISEMQPDEILPGVTAFLEDLRKRNIKIALGSASKNARAILEKVSLLHYFDAIIDGTLVTASKPDPEVFIKGAEALNVQPAECIVFEDAEAGVQAAIAGGMRVVGIGDPALLNEADLVIPGFENLSFDQLTELTR